ncbi:MAG: serine/threonine-protein phosphatase [Planctomycetes bacterium]|nr:serine/threonine-protein phosphatase [Planctomycetota bacterium]
MARSRSGRQDEAEQGGQEGGGRGRMPDRTAKVPTGPSFAMAVGLGAGFSAATLAFIAVLAASAGGGDPSEAVDVGGVQAARLLAAPGMERWRAGFGTTNAARAKAREFLDNEVNKSKDDREKGPRRTAKDDFWNGKSSSGMDWKPGFEMIFPPADPNDDLLEASRKKALTEAVAAAPGTRGAAVLDVGGSLLLGAGTDVRAISGAPSKTVGDTKIYVTAPGVRQYEHPIKTKNGIIDGRAVVVLSTENVHADSPMLSAGLAALAALIGGFSVGFVLALGPVKAMRRLAQDTDAIASGKWDTRIGLAGPDVVQHTAKSVQRIVQAAANAANAAAAEPAAPQIIEQQVMVQPSAEVQEGLSPLKSFRRPEELEIEATQKPCPDLGNDYYDVVNVDDTHVGVFIADIPSVRGVRGAMYMAQIRAIFRAVSPSEQSPAEVLKLLNRAFAADLPRGIYVTAMYAIVDKTSGICRVASAQHLPLVFWKAAKKASAKLAPEGIALGLDPGPVFDKTIVEKAIQLEKGDRIVLFTDGAMNARNLSNAQYGDERFYYVVNREAPKNSAACVNFVANDVDLFHEGAAQTDDFTIVTVRKMR